MKHEFTCIAVDPEELHKGKDLVAEWRTVTLAAKNAGGNGVGGALGAFQLPSMTVADAKMFEVGKSYLISIEAASPTELTTVRAEAQQRGEAHTKLASPAA
jgi:hypothetical protein